MGPIRVRPSPRDKRERQTKRPASGDFLSVFRHRAEMMVVAMAVVVVGCPLMPD